LNALSSKEKGEVLQEKLDRRKKQAKQEEPQKEPEPAPEVKLAKEEAPGPIQDEDIPF